MDSERALEEAWISNNEIIGVVFKNNFTYYLRFPTGNVAIPNDNLGYIGRYPAVFLCSLMPLLNCHFFFKLLVPVEHLNLQFSSSIKSTVVYE